MRQKHPLIACTGFFVTAAASYRPEGSPRPNAPPDPATPPRRFYPQIHSDTTEHQAKFLIHLFPQSPQNSTSRIALKSILRNTGLTIASGQYLNNNMKIQLKEATADLTKLLKRAKIRLDDWYTQTDKINEAIQEVGLVICLDWHCTEMEGLIEVSYYSNKIYRRIIIDSDSWHEAENYRDFASELVAYHDEARKLERKLPKIRTW